MSQKMLLKILVFFALFSLTFPKNFSKFRRQNLSLLRNFTCSVVKDELEKNPELRTVAMVELESDFEQGFSAGILKCLPVYVTKVVIQPHTHIYENNSVQLSKNSMVIYLADRFEVRNLIFRKFKNIKILGIL